MQQQYENNERQHNLRARVVNFVKGQEVFRRNFKQSNFAEGYSAQLGPRFLKARVRKKLGDTYYALEDVQGEFLANITPKTYDNNGLICDTQSDFGRRYL